MIRFRPFGFVMMSALALGSVARADINYTFVDGDEFDGVGIGATMMRADPANAADFATLTSVDILAATIDADLSTMTSAREDGSAHLTTVGGSGLGIDNAHIGGAESAQFKMAESWVVTFDKDVYLASIDLDGMSSSDTMELRVDGVTQFTFDYGDADPNDPYSLGGTFVAAGSEITFADISGGSIRIQTLSVSTMYAATVTMALEAANGWHIPKIMGASGDQALLTGFDYFDWYGVTEHRTWFKPAFSSLTDDSGITSASAFAAASEAIRQDPMRQATSGDTYIDWAHFYDEYNDDQMPERMQHLAERDIMPMIIDTVFISETSIEDDWVSIYGYWKYWYTLVYYFASEHDVTMYQMKNEPHAHVDYDTWESHWLVAADAMRKAMDDVNADFGKTLTLNHCGPVCPGVYWDYSLPHPDEDIHSWGSTSWNKVKYDIYGNYDESNPWNYGSYDYHRYGLPASRSEEILLGGRSDIGNATNDVWADIPLVISEFNTSSGGKFDGREEDTEELVYGVGMALNLEAISVHGPEGLGDDGGFFIFKLGAAQSGTSLVGLGNKLSYVSQNAPNNYGGITRGGATFQMFSRYFRGGKPQVPVSVTSGADDEFRTLAAIDEEKGMVYIYGANSSGSGESVSIDLSAQDVEAGAVASLQRVDEMNTGQVTELLTLDASQKLSFECPDNTAFLIKVPMTGTTPYQWEVTPSEDTTQQISDTGNLGASSTMNVSMHHSDAAQRNVGLLRFSVDGAGNMGQALLKLSGRNAGTDQSEREIVHVYAVTGEDWSEDATLAWNEAPGLGQYHVDESTMGVTDGTGDMVDIEDNYGGYTSGAGTGLGLMGEFVGAVSFHSSDYVDNYLDVSDYLNSVDHDGAAPLDVTFVVARIVRYDVNVYSNSYYDVGVYHYDGRVVEIATKEHADVDLQPRLICSSGLPPVIDAEDFAHSSGVSVQASSDVDGGSMVEFSAAGNSVSYEVRVSEAGTYLVGFRVASDSGAVNLELAQDGTPITTLNRFVGAGETWTTLYKMVTLEAGFTTLTVTATDGDVQFLNWIELSTSTGLFEESLPPEVDPINLALNQPASASNVHSSSYSADKAVDGSLATRWATTVLTPWMEVDLGEAVWINGTMIVEDRDRIRSYEIQVYNGSWETAFVGGNPTSGQAEEFTPVLGSKVRLQITAATQEPTLEEWEVYGTDPIDQSSTMALNADSISFEWPNVPGATYAVQRSTNLVTDSFLETVESGIPALTETNSITIKMPEDPSAFYRIIAE